MSIRRPASLREALMILQDDNARVIAGATDLMVTGLAADINYVDIRTLHELRCVTVAGDYVDIGAATTYSDVIVHPLLGLEFPMLIEAARQTGAVAIQNRGTLGGNIANASPAADTPPALLAYDAEIELVSAKGSRRIPYAQFHTGYKKTQMRADELIASIRIPRLKYDAHYYRKVGTRRAQAIAKVGIAACRIGDEFRVAMSSVAAMPIRCYNFSDLASEISPIDDIRSTGKFRLQVAQNLLRECLASITPKIFGA